MREGPNGYFFYANLNYVLAGAVIEAVTGARFDIVLRRLVLAPLGIGGGFNWAGVADRNRLPMYQRRDNILTLEADGPTATGRPIWCGALAAAFRLTTIAWFATRTCFHPMQGCV